MKKNHSYKHISGGQTDDTSEIDLPGYPSYPESDDIFIKFREEQDINPEDTSATKVLNEESVPANRKDFIDDTSGADLDVPGSELDDAMEEIGSEDEENNYYSLGGDNHTDLDENKD